MNSCIMCMYTCMYILYVYIYKYVRKASTLLTKLRFWNLQSPRNCYCLLMFRTPLPEAIFQSRPRFHRSAISNAKIIFFKNHSIYFSERCRLKGFKRAGGPSINPFNLQKMNPRPRLLVPSRDPWRSTRTARGYPGGRKGPPGREALGPSLGV